MSSEIEHTVGSDNVFTDLKLPDAEVAMLKAELARAITRVIAERGWTQTTAAEQMGLDQPKISAITRGRLSGFSVERLMECLGALRQDLVIDIRPSAEEHGRILVSTGS